MAEPPHIVVGNPKALQKLITAGRLRLSAVNTVVVDEVDACLLSDETRQELHALLSRYLSSSFKQQDEPQDADSGTNKLTENAVFTDQTQQFRKDMTAGGGAYRNSRQTILCSATVPQRQYFAMQCFKNGWTETLPEVLHISAAELMPAQVQHEVVEVEDRAKTSCVRHLLRTEAAAWASICDGQNAAGEKERPFQAIVFADSDESSAEVCEAIRRGESDSSFSVTFLTEAMGLEARARALDDVRSGDSDVLVCTELLARGIDVPSLTHVLQITLPSKPENYLHR